jgi:hypothetical protein
LIFRQIAAVFWSCRSRHFRRGHPVRKVSVLEVVGHGGHFATLCRELDFYVAKFFFIINFQKEKANTFTLLIIIIAKSLQIELHSTNLLL